MIDLAGVIYISSSGWGVLVKYMQRTGTWGGRMAISGMSQPIFKIFRDLGFEPLIPYFISTDAALAELSAPPAESVVETPAPVVESPPPVEEPVAEETAPVDSFRSEPLPEKPEGPVIGRSGIEPIKPSEREHVEALDVKLDLSEEKGETRERKDGKIRKLGWGEYGKKLFERNAKRDGRKKKK